MTQRRSLNERQVDGLLKAMLVFSRTVSTLLEGRAVCLAGESLSSSKVQIVRLLGQRGAQTASRIAGFLGVSKPAVTQIIDSMATGGLVTRRRSRSDRRGVELTLTARGREVFRKVLAEQRHLVRSAMRVLGRRGPAHCTDVLQDVAAALARADRGVRDYCLQCGAHADGSCVLVGGDANCLFLRQQAREASARHRKAVRRARRPQTARGQDRC